jgi:hypothetical protein
MVVVVSISIPSAIEIEHLLNALPPRRLPTLTARRSRDQTLLVAVRHLPPLPNLGVLAHLLHVALVVVAGVLEGGEEDVGCGVVEDGVWKGRFMLASPL